jgi:hypothetical protein
MLFYLSLTVIFRMRLKMPNHLPFPEELPTSLCIWQLVRGYVDDPGGGSHGEACVYTQ